MTRPLLVTKYRGVGTTACEVFQNSGGTLVSLFTYGTAGLATSVDFKPGSLAAHWAGKIYAIAPEEGIYVNTPPETSGVLLHSFTSPDTGVSSFCMDWQIVLKDGKTQLFTLFKDASTLIRMIFIDEDGILVETDAITIINPASNMSYMRGFNFGNKIYTSSLASSNADIQITDPEAESTQQISWAATTYSQSDLAAHSGKMYGYTQQSSATVGLGNALWDISSAVPTKLLEWNGRNSPGPASYGQNCIFSDSENLICVGIGSGSIVDEIDVWKIDFDSNGIPQGVISVRDTVFGFESVPQVEGFRCYASRDLESTIGEVATNLHIVTGNGSTEGNGIHHYKWNGPGQAATYLGVGGDTFAFDAPSWKVGGGSRTFTNQQELDLIVTNVAPTGANVDITYLITGQSARPEGIAMAVMFNNLKDSPTSLATVTPITNGVSSGIYIAGLNTGESGVFRWNISADGILPEDVPNLSAALIRI